MSSFIISNVAEGMILFAKQLFDQKKKRKPFLTTANNMRFHRNINRIELFGLSQKQGWWNVKNKNYSNYSMCGVCGLTLAVSSYSSSLTLLQQLLRKDRHSVDLLEISNFLNPRGSVTKKGCKRVWSKNISDKGTKRTKSTERAIILSKSLTELTKLKSLIKFNDQPKVPLGQNLPNQNHIFSLTK